HLATGHQRHYNILYHEAMDMIQRGTLGDLHYIRAQWHRSNLPGSDSWRQPLPPGVKPQGDPGEKKVKDLAKELASWKGRLNKALGREIDLWRRRVAQLEAQMADVVLNEKGKDGKTPAERYGYEPVKSLGADGKPVYQGPAIEELIRWRLWDRTGGGLMVELGSHQLDAASLFIAAAHGGEKKPPLNVMAVGNRPLFPPNRDVDDHIACIFEFPAPGYDAKDPNKEKKKIGVQYASINGNGFGGYGEIVYGTKGTLVLEREQELTPYTDSAKSKITTAQASGPALDTQASGPAQVAVAGAKREVSRGYREELEHWAWCIKNPAPENRPHCHPKVALGDAVIALVTNLSAKKGRRINFEPEWFDPQSDVTPEGVKPDVGRYA
ncbi:MAG: gfo/Idh/MocA family oxidoreductase, partial [Pirellulales bacterium]|nr:gfo/Idh/MocA family oxidoreductase [Pirellulales bacterium]